MGLVAGLAPGGCSSSPGPACSNAQCREVLGTNAYCDPQTWTCECVPTDCADRCSGPDGCGGSCGTCEAPEVCDQATGRCVCVPDCSGKACGEDGCGGSCGDCATNESCTEKEGARSCRCQGPYKEFEEFTVPENPRDGLGSNPEIFLVCDSLMSDEYFLGMSLCWKAGDGHGPFPGGDRWDVQAVYHMDEKRLYLLGSGFQPFEIRANSRGVLVYSEVLVMLNFTPTVAYLVQFNRYSGDFDLDYYLYPVAC